MGGELVRGNNPREGKIDLFPKEYKSSTRKKIEGPVGEGDPFPEGYQGEKGNLKGNFQGGLKGRKNLGGRS